MASYVTEEIGRNAPGIPDLLGKYKVLGRYRSKICKIIYQDVTSCRIRNPER